MLRIKFALENGSPASMVTILDGKTHIQFDPAQGPYPLDPNPPRVIIFAPQDGYWDVLFSTSGLTSGVVPILFRSIAVSPTVSWWLELHGVSASQATSTPARVGIIDEALEPQPAASCISHIRNLGGLAWGDEFAPRALTPITDHGQAVCSLVSSRATSGLGAKGVVPDAHVFFAAAGLDGVAELDLPRLVACIDTLVDDFECDVLSISAGDWKEPLETLEVQVEEAADKGTLCFFAAGNKAELLYPACYPICLTVAALGQYDSAPDDTLVAFHNQYLSDSIAGSTYIWQRSAQGPAIHFCAPGIGVVWNRFGSAAKGVVGTSYACPIAAGLAALILGSDPQFMQMPRTRARYDYGVGVLAARCRPFGVANEVNLWKYGRLWVS